MTIGDYVALVSARRWIVICSGVLGILLGLAYAFEFETPYQARSSVYLQSNVPEDPNMALEMSTYMEGQILTYAEVADKPLLQDEVREVVGHDVSSAHMTAVVSADVVQGTHAINISALAENPQMSINIANATADALVEYVAASEPRLNGEPLLRVTVSAPASEANSVLPGSPARPTMGLVVGLLVGTAVALFLPASRFFPRPGL